MPKYQVLQADRESMRELLFYKTFQSPVKARQMLNGEPGAGRYEKVADVEVGTHVTDTIAALEFCFLFTNTAGRCWWENDHVTPTDAAKNGCRSTSVGDVIVTPDGVHYIVAPCGFEKVPD